MTWRKAVVPSQGRSIRRCACFQFCSRRYGYHSRLTILSRLMHTCAACAWSTSKLFLRGRTWLERENEWIVEPKSSSSAMTKQQSTRSCPIGGSGKKWTMMRWSNSRRWTGRRETRFASVMAIERSSSAASGLRKTDISGCGSTLAVSTSEAAQSYRRLSIPCIGGMKMRKYAMRTSMTSPVHPFPLGGTGWGIPTSVDGRSGSRVGGRSKQRPVLQQGLAKHRWQEDARTYPTRYYWNCGAYIDRWTSRKSSVHCSNHVMGSPSEDDASRRQSLFADGSSGREYADAVWRGEKSISPSSAGDHPRIERPKHLCVEFRKGAAWQHPRGWPGRLLSLWCNGADGSRRIHPISQNGRPRRRHRGPTRHIPDHESRHPNFALLRFYRDSCSNFRAWLPCRSRPLDPSVVCTGP